jgi:hypothetical protein
VVPLLGAGHGQIKVSAIIRNSLGQVVARIDANQFRLTAGNNGYDFNFDKTGLEVINAENTVVLQVNLRGNVADVNGIFYNTTGDVVIFDQDSMRIRPSIINVHIDLIFKHPGIKYIGQRLAS